jgi:hypothetical protein
LFDISFETVVIPATTYPPLALELEDELLKLEELELEDELLKLLDEELQLMSSFTRLKYSRIRGLTQGCASNISRILLSSNHWLYVISLPPYLKFKR